MIPARVSQLDLASLYQEILHYLEQLGEIAKRRQPLVINQHSDHAYISDEFTT